MRMTTKASAFVVVLAMVLAGCGDGTGSTTTVGETTTTAAETTTSAPADTTTTAAQAGAGIVPGEDPDVDAIVEVYRIVFDSTTTFEEKAPYIVDPEGLEETVATYTATGEQVGGVTAEPTEVTIDGETAAVVYTLLFAGNPTYPGQSGDAVLTDDGWKISREMFCGVMASARSACPTG